MSLASITGQEFLDLFPPFLPSVGNYWRPPVVPRDARYALPSLSWLRNEYRAYFRAELERLDLTSWSAEDHDCDNSAALYAAHAQICKAKMKLGDGLALAVAYIEYYRSSVAPYGMHAICAAAVEDRRLVFVEPAYEYGCDVTQLTPTEQSSVRLIII